MVAQASPQTQAGCALCGLPVQRQISATIAGQTHHFCCYACRYIYQTVAPEVACGVSLPVAIGQAGLDLNAPCCRGIIHGDPAEAARNTLSRLMLNAFLAMMVMVLSLALYSDFFFAAWGAEGAGARSMLQVMAMLFATPAVLLLAIPILEDAVLTFQVYRQLTTSALIAVGSLAAYGLSVYATFTGQGHTYFETATMTLLLVTLGRWLDARTLVAGDRALNELLARTPAEASRITDDGEIRVPVAALQVGDRVRVRPGEFFAVDGRIIDGAGSVDEATITGESTPAYKGPADPVYAGTVNLDGSFLLEATQVGEARVVGKLARLLDEARLHRAPIERLADRISAYFVPTVILLALGTFVCWSWQASFERGLLNALAVLLIACPCALGIATPLAIWAALGRAAQAGILIRDSLTLEKLARVRQLFFDKTGTLSTGQPTLSQIVAPAGETLAETDLLAQAAALEYHAEHPLARAISAEAAARGLTLPPVDTFQAWPGLGISGRLAGETVYLGSRRLVDQQGLRLPPDLAEAAQDLAQQGATVVYLGRAGWVRGLLGLVETIRDTAGPALAQLRAAGLQIEILTGDGEDAAQALGRRLGAPVRARLLPQDKLAAIAAAEANGPVAMVGDGINDAPALARAGVGLAMGCGADVTREAADVSLLGDDLRQIGWTLKLARRAYRTIAWNLGWAFLYNLIGIGLAMAGLLHPVLAAAAMVLSSALVVGNSLRILRTS